MQNASIHCLSLNPALDIAGVADTVEPTRKIRVSEQCEYPGGGAINVARVLDTLGADVSLTYVAGGAYGEVLQTGINALGLTNYCLKTDTNTRISYTIFEKKTEREYRFVSSGEPIQETTVRSAMTHLESIECEYLVLSGSLPLNAPIDTYTRVALSAKKRGVKVILDCSGDELESTLDAGCTYFVKPSFGELERLAGRKLDESSAIQFAQSLVQQKKATAIAVTMGKHGAFLCTENATLRAPAVRVRVQSAVGAGDSFVAGMLSRLAKRESLKDGFAYAIAAGAGAVMTTGTNLCDAKNVRKLLPYVVVTQIA